MNILKAYLKLIIKMYRVDKVVKTSKPTFIDLFCGCGGFSTGMKRAGFRTLASIDFNKEAIDVYKANFPRVPGILQDITKYPPEKLEQEYGTHSVDVIIGGPPCQGFSTVRKRDGTNHGLRVINDNRRYLYQEFLRYVEYFKPKIFVMENVLGIRTASCGEYYKRVQHEARNIGYRVHGIVINASDYGVPQKRRRQLIIGTRLDLPVYFNEAKHLRGFKVSSPVKMGDVIGDLPPLKAGEGREIQDYDMDLRIKSLRNLSENGIWYLYKVLKLDQSSNITSHVARPHSQRDLDDFALLKEGENCSQAMKRGVVFKFPYKMTYFKDKYTRQNGNGLCSTIVAHMSKDGLMFIHPTQNRSLTVREAARIQSFPDTFSFPVPRTYQYRLIGNAVPPLIGEVIGRAIKKYLRDVDYFNKHCSEEKLSRMPKDQIDAAERLSKLVNAVNDGTIRAMPIDTFRDGWYSVGFLFPRIHPDGVTQDGNGSGKLYDDYPDIDVEIKKRYPELSSAYYKQNGCPLFLEPVIREACRRFKKGELVFNEYYSSYALLAGINHRPNGRYGHCPIVPGADNMVKSGDGP